MDTSAPVREVRTRGGATYHVWPGTLEANAAGVMFLSAVDGLSQPILRYVAASALSAVTPQSLPRDGRCQDRDSRDA